MTMVDTWLGPVTSEDLESWKYVELYMGPLKELYLDDDVTEIMVNRFDRVFVERNGRIVEAGVGFKSESDLRKLIVQVGLSLGQPFDNDHPILNARFPDASRLCCTLPIVSPGGSTITLRKAPKRFFTFEELISFGALTDEMVGCITDHIQQASAMIVSGNTASGKTTILRACDPLIPAHERKITAEDTQELHLVGALALEAPKRRQKKDQEPVTLDMLIETMLRMRPDRPWVGEIRTAAAAGAFLQLINTGHTGCATTIHANSCADAVRRIQYLIAASGKLDFELAGHQVLGSIQLLVHCARTYAHGRRVKELCRVENERIIPLFRFDETIGRHVAC